MSYSPHSSYTPRNRHHGHSPGRARGRLHSRNGHEHGSTDPHGVTTWAVIRESISMGHLEVKIMAEVQGSREEALAELLRQAKRFRGRKQSISLYRDGDRYLLPDPRYPSIFKLWERVHLDV